MLAYRRFGPLLVATILLAPGCGTARNEPTLEEVRSIAEKYRDVNVANAEGYTTDNKCVTAEMRGPTRRAGHDGIALCPP
jgi:hypothetical protein